MKLILLIIFVSYIYSDDPFVKDDYGRYYFNDCGSTILTITKNSQKIYFQNPVNAKSVDDCKGKQLEYERDYYMTKDDEDKIKSIYTHCCYLTYDGFNHENVHAYDSDGDDTIEREGGCVALTDAEYNHIGEFIKYKQMDNEYYNYNLKLDCFSNYLKIGFFNLILLILF